MSFSKKTIRDWDLQGKRVLLRVDYNVPMHKDGTIADDYRISQSLPTLEYLIEKQCKIVLCSHLGRPKGAQDASCSLKEVAKRLTDLLNRNVQFVTDCVGKEVSAAAEALQPGQVLLLENLRFHPEEEANDAEFAAQLVADSHAEVFVQDAFGVVHRAHASTDAVARLLPALSGLLLEREVETITNVMQNPERPLMAIIGGAKIHDKIDLLYKFIDIADFMVIGGAMANTFLLAEGINIGMSVADREEVDVAKDVLEKARAKAKAGDFVFYLPQDGVVATSHEKNATTRIVDWDAHIIAAVQNYPKPTPHDTAKVKDDESILDIGPFSGAFIAGGMQLAKTVIWNGAMGLTETPSLHGPVGPFAHGTELVVDGLLGEFGHKPFSLLGGGDTVNYVESRGLTDMFNHVSTGGGASLELMAGKVLPGVDCLWNKD